jgi:hypothetical protein
MRIAKQFNRHNRDLRFLRMRRGWLFRDSARKIEGRATINARRAGGQFVLHAL